MTKSSKAKLITFFIWTKEALENIFEVKSLADLEVSGNVRS